MSKTIRYFPRGCFRYPRGQRQALINKVRSGAIPPTAYDDIPYACCNETYVKSRRIMEELMDKGYNTERIARILIRKFKGLSYLRAYGIVRWYL